MSDHLGVQFGPEARAKLPKPIEAHELPNSDTVHQTSPQVSRNEFRQVAQRGVDRLSKMAAGFQDITQLHEHFGSVAEHAYAATRQPWGGATYNPRTGSPVDFHKPDKHALTARDPGQESVTLPANASHEQFAGAMAQAASVFSGNLTRSQHYLGVFHNADAGRVEIDPVVVAHGKDRAAGERISQELSAATHATGGAYSFNTGNGVYPPHVKDVYTPPRAR